MIRRFTFLVFLLALNGAMGDVPLRECTLKAPVSAVKLTPAKLKAYQQGSEVILKTAGFLFPADTDKNIEAPPTGDNSTPFRTAINYHRSLRNDDLETITGYWHPTLQSAKKQQFARPGVMANTKKAFVDLDHVELLGMLKLENRNVVFLRYQGKTRAFVTVEQNGVYYLVSDPGLQTQIEIARAAFDSGSATMAQ